MWSLSSNALIILTLTHAPYCKCCRYQFRKLSKIILLQDGNVLCHIEPSCGLGDLLHENSYWEQQQQYFETIPAIKDTTETPFQSESESTKEFNTLFSVTEVPQSNIFIEKITIPESEHDTVTAIYSEKVRASTNKDRPYRLKSRHKAANAKHFRDIKLQERSKKHVRKTDPIKTKTFAFSNELIQRYISFNDGTENISKTSEEEGSRVTEHEPRGRQNTQKQGSGTYSPVE